jgi:hypothetical protein
LAGRLDRRTKLAHYFVPNEVSPVTSLLQKLSQTLAMVLILEIASHNFIVYPVIPPEIRRRLTASQPLNLSQIPHGKRFAIVLQPNVST